MTKPNTGGAAFPNPQIPHPGMTLRDWFAGQALAGFCSRTDAGPNDGPILVAAAYKLADLMLAEREKAPD